jgi:hypothetical protein
MDKKTTRVTSDWKLIILQRYAGEYPPYAGSGVPLKKTSEDVAFDLSGMGEFSPDEVSAFMAVSGYTIDFDDGKPVWLLTTITQDKALPE